MKKMMVACLMLLSVKAFSQDYPKHQINLNIANVIAIAAIEVGYEHYVGLNQSVELEMFFNDRFSYFPKNSDKKFSATSIKLGYNYYFDPENLSGPYVNPFIKQRFGKYKETEGGNVTEVKLNSFILGVGLGYQWNYNDTFIVAPFVNIARNFGSEINDSKKFWAVEPNAGLKIGYKF